MACGDMSDSIIHTNWVLFRVDASPFIGVGHVMRCMSLAKGLSQHGLAICFLAREMPEQLQQQITAAGFSFASLHSNLEPSMEAEEKALANLLEQYGSRADWIIVDSYSLDSHWEAMARQFASKLMVVDDLANRDHDCDLLLDQTLGRSVEDYQSLVPEICRILTGTSYALLRTEFSSLREGALKKRECFEGINSIVVSLGGGDQMHLLEDIFSGIEKFVRTLSTNHSIPNSVLCRVVLGSAASEFLPYLPQVNGLQWELLRNVGNMAELLHDADVVIGAAGTSAWERCTLGVPSLMLVVADNQELVARALVNKGAALMMKSPYDISVAEGLEALNDPDTYREMSRHTLSLCDGRGVERVVHIMRARCSLRKATINDAALLLNWRNDVRTVEASHSTKQVEFSEHMAWLSGALVDNTLKLFICERQGAPVGTVRAHLKQGVWVLSWTVAPEFRGQGIAKEMVALAVASLCGPFRAEVKEGNVASMSVAEHIGMTLVNKADGVLYYEK